MNIQFTPKATEACSKPTAPVVLQEFQTITDATPLGPFLGTSGDAAFENQLVSNPGCAPVRLVVQYLQDPNDGCDSCTPSSDLVVVDVTIDVPGGVDAWELPAGFAVGLLSVTPLDVVGAAGVATAPAEPQSFMYYATGNSGCCPVLIP